MGGAKRHPPLAFEFPVRHSLFYAPDRAPEIWNYFYAGPWGLQLFGIKHHKRLTPLINFNKFSIDPITIGL